MSTVQLAGHRHNSFHGQSAPSEATKWGLKLGKGTLGASHSLASRLESPGLQDGGPRLHVQVNHVGEDP